MNRPKIVTVCGAVLLIAAAVAVVVALRNRQQPAPPPDAPVAALPAEVRVKAVERKPEPLDHEVVEASSAVAIVRGADPTTADRYEARNDALRSIARRRDLPAYTEGSDPFAHVQIYGPPGKNPPAGRYLW